MPDDISLSLDELLERVVPGQVVAGYRLAEQIGAGGMAVVFRAADDKLGRQVALKLLAPALASDAEFRERFSREARASTAAEHPHIIPVYDAGEADGILYIAMRRVSGGDLRKLIERTGSLPPDRVAEIISAIASALDAAHGAGLVHRDVNPSNILIDQPSGLPGHVYLSDFGLSKAISSASDISRANELRGTPECMAPEQIQGVAVDGRADQYALACVAVHLLTGRPAYEGGITQVLAAHLTAPPPSVHARRQELRPAVDDVIERAMAREPAGRYTTCGLFAAALRSALVPAPASGRTGSQAAVVTSPAIVPSAVPETSPPGREPSRRGRRRAGIALASAIAVVAVAVAAVLIYPSLHRPGPDAGRVSDGVSGLSYSLLAAPWRQACPSRLNGPAFTWTAGEEAPVGSVLDHATQVPWYGLACSGVLPPSYRYTGVTGLESTATSLVSTFDVPFYREIYHQVAPVASMRVSVSGSPGWEVRFLVTYPYAASHQLAWNSEEAAVIVVDRGAGTRPGVFYVSVPNSLPTTEVDTLVGSLRLTRSGG